MFRKVAALALLGGLLILLVKPSETTRPTDDPTTQPQSRPSKHAESQFFSIGSTKQRVVDVMGEPDAIVANDWFYGHSKVSFYRNLVEGFTNSHDSNYNLKVSMVPNPTLLGTVHVGLTKRQVLAVYGTPKEVHASCWVFPNSKINYDDAGIVVRIERLKTVRTK